MGVCDVYMAVHPCVNTIPHHHHPLITQVLVMDQGRVKEYDTVKRLLSRQDSQFRSMVSEAGLLNENASATIEEEAGEGSTHNTQ